MDSTADMIALGKKIGALLRGGEVLVLKGDIGAGKTTLTKGIALGLGVQGDVQSPTFTISRVYDGRGDVQLAHYDFYRLTDPGILKAEISEAAADPKTIVVIEWGDTIESVLPQDRLMIQLSAPSETARDIVVTARGERSRAVVKGIA